MSRQMLEQMIFSLSRGIRAAFVVPNVVKAWSLRPSPTGTGRSTVKVCEHKLELKFQSVMTRLSDFQAETTSIFKYHELLIKQRRNIEFLNNLIEKIVCLLNDNQNNNN